MSTLLSPRAQKLRAATRRVRKIVNEGRKSAYAEIGRDLEMPSEAAVYTSTELDQIGRTFGTIWLANRKTMSKDEADHRVYVSAAMLGMNEIESYRKTGSFQWQP